MLRKSFKSVAVTSAVAVFALMAFTAADRRAETGVEADWPNTGGDTQETGFSRLTEINSGNVDQLGLAWSLDLDGEVTLEGTPVAVDGILYVTGGTSSVYAVEGETGKLLWKYDPEIWKHNPERQSKFGANRGVAYAGGRVFVGVLDGRLEALDAKSGSVLWSVQTLQPGDLRSISGAPRLFKDKVIIGHGGGDMGERGYVTAYDQATGKLAWRFYTAPRSPDLIKGDVAMEAAAKTWPDQYWQKPSGGAVWNGITYDEELNRIYIAVANPDFYSADMRASSGRDRLFTASIVALDADTGKYIWHYQMNPRDAWDYGMSANMILADLAIDGRPRKVLMNAPKNGFFYVLDRQTGALLSAEKIGKATWADRIDLETGRPVETENARYTSGQTIVYPSGLGTHNWQPMSFNPKTGLVYIPYIQLGARWTNRPKEGSPGKTEVTYEPYVGGPEDGRGAVLAWDPVQKKARWSAPIETVWNGGTLTTAGDLVFSGAGDGYFSAYDALTGKRLWRFNAGHGIIGAPTSFLAGGAQYVSVLSGYGGTVSAVGQVMNAGWKYGAQPRRLLTFRIGGRATLPPSAPRDMTVKAVDNPDLKIDEAAAAQGRAMSAMCMGCHGLGFRGVGSPGPDLRESQLALDEEAFFQVVHEGALMQRGMPRFDKLSREQVRGLYMYLRAAAREATGARPLSDPPLLSF